MVEPVQQAPEQFCLSVGQAVEDQLQPLGGGGEQAVSVIDDENTGRLGQTALRAAVGLINSGSPGYLILESLRCFLFQ